MSEFVVPALGPGGIIGAIVRIGTAIGRPGATVAFFANKILCDVPMPRVVRRYEPTDKDVYIATYSKSGTNWAMQIALQLIGEGKAEFGHVHEVVPWPEAPARCLPLSDQSHLDRSPSGMRVIKSHQSARAVPYSEAAKYITVVRDPKEVVVSAYHFVTGIFGLKNRIGFEEWYDRLVRHGQLLQGWAAHTASFWDWRERDNVLVLSYSEMKADLVATVRRFADHIGLDPSPAVFDEVVHRSGFEFMKGWESRFGPPKFPFRPDAPKALMMRRGESGKSSEALSEAQQAEIDALARKCLSELDSDYPYDERFG